VISVTYFDTVGCQKGHMSQKSSAQTVSDSSMVVSENVNCILLVCILQFAKKIYY